MKNHTLNDLGGLVTLVDQHRGEGWIYRGVPRCDYELIPSIGRENVRGMSPDGERYQYNAIQEKQLLEEFKRRAPPLVAWQPEHPLEWLALGQHHGLLTRLLDWTESIFVAARFAVESGVTYKPSDQTGERRRVPPAIYGVRKLPVAQPSENPFQMRGPKLYRPPHISQRIVAQQAVLTIHPEPQVPYDSDCVHRWVLNIGATLDWKAALEEIGFTRAMLFPGIDGLAESLTWRYKWNLRL